MTFYFWMIVKTCFKAIYDGNEKMPTEGWYSRLLSGPPKLAHRPTGDNPVNPDSYADIINELAIKDINMVRKKLKSEKK